MKRILGRVCVLACAVTSCGAEDDLLKEFNKVWGKDYDISVSQETPDMDVDVGAQVTRFENKINESRSSSDSDTTNYEILLALCKTEPGKVCDPPEVARFPNRIPRYLWPYGCKGGTTGAPTWLPAEQCTMPMTCEETDPATISNGVNPSALPAGNGCVDIADWMAQVPGLDELTSIAQAVAFDVSEHGSLKDISQVKEVTIDRVTINFKENSLTYAVPIIETYAGAPVSDEEARDAKALIAANKVTLFGSLTDVPAAYTGERNMELQEAGKLVLSDSIRGFKATLGARAALEMPPETDPARADNCRDPAHVTTHATDYCESFPKPGGKVKFTVDVGVTFTINPSGR